MYQRILLAVDGSPTSDQALREAARLVTATARLTVVTVAEDPALLYNSPYGIDPAIVRRAVLDQAAAVLEQARKQLAALGVKAETRLAELAELAEAGIYSAGEAILHEAGRCQADLIVLGTHGRRGVRRFFMGSVAEQVARQASVPVLLVRGTPPAEPRVGGEQYDDWPITPGTDR